MQSENYKHVNSRGTTYHLNKKDVTLRGGKVQTIYYFSRDERDTATFLPDNMEVFENPRNGFVGLRRIK